MKFKVMNEDYGRLIIDDRYPEEAEYSHKIYLPTDTSGKVELKIFATMNDTRHGREVWDIGVDLDTPMQLNAHINIDETKLANYVDNYMHPYLTSYDFDEAEEVCENVREYFNDIDLDDFYRTFVEDLGCDSKEVEKLWIAPEQPEDTTKPVNKLDSIREKINKVFYRGARGVITSDREVSFKSVATDNMVQNFDMSMLTWSDKGVPFVKVTKGQKVSIVSDLSDEDIYNDAIYYSCKIKLDNYGTLFDGYVGYDDELYGVITPSKEDDFVFYPIENMNESKELNKGTLTEAIHMSRNELMSTVDELYNHLGSEIEDILYKNSASVDDSTEEGYFQTMSDDDIRNAFYEIKRFVIDKYSKNDYEECPTAVIDLLELETVNESKGLNEGNPVSGKIPESIDGFLQDIAQMYQTIDYGDIMDHNYSEEDIKKLKSLRRKFREEAQYEGDEEAEAAMKDIAEKVAVILKTKNESKELNESLSEKQIAEILNDAKYNSDDSQSEYYWIGYSAAAFLVKESDLFLLLPDHISEEDIEYKDMIRGYKDNNGMTIFNESKELNEGIEDIREVVNDHIDWAREELGDASIDKYIDFFENISAEAGYSINRHDLEKVLHDYLDEDDEDEFDDYDDDFEDDEFEESFMNSPSVKLHESLFRGTEG